MKKICCNAGDRVEVSRLADELEIQSTRRKEKARLKWAKKDAHQRVSRRGDVRHTVLCTGMVMINDNAIGWRSRIRRVEGYATADREA